MVLLIIFIFSAFVALAMGVMAGATDIRGLKIPNMYPLAIIGAFIPAFAVDAFSGAEVFSALTSHAIALGVVFILTFALFHFRVFGGGDSKLLTAYALWTGLAGLPVLLFYMALFGALIGGAALYIQKRKPFANPPATSWVGQLQGGASKVPYGVAITVGALIAFIQLGYVSPQSWGLFLTAS